MSGKKSQMRRKKYTYVHKIRERKIQKRKKKLCKWPTRKMCKIVQINENN